MNYLTKFVSNSRAPFSNKPLVFYRADRPYLIQIGKPAFVYPINHPDTVNVTSDGATPVATSPVVMMNLLSGEFWTHNSHYAPIMP